MDRICCHMVLNNSTRELDWQNSFLIGKILTDKVRKFNKTTQNCLQKLTPCTSKYVFGAEVRKSVIGLLVP